MRTLIDYHYKRHFKAKRGEHGKGSNCHGKDGESIIIPVPPGTVVFKIKGDKAGQDLGEEELEYLGELIDGDMIVAKGGRGGLGNARFKSSTRQRPYFATKGEKGEQAWLFLELKLIADVGIVGLPNAGKSTLLSKLSAARPKIADYPFTTLAPNLGYLELEDGRGLTIADMPGIIENAHKGKGLGLEFLRHIERTKVLLFLLDITSDPLHDLAILENEIKEYNPYILKKRNLIVFNKIDLVDERKIKKIKESVNDPVFFISALRGDGVEELKEALIKITVEKDG